MPALTPPRCMRLGVLKVIIEVNAMTCAKRILIAGLFALGLAACGEQNSGSQSPPPAAQPSSTPGQTQSTQ